MKNSELIEVMLKFSDDIAREGDDAFESANDAYHAATRSGKWDVAKTRVVEMATANGKITAANRIRAKLYELRATVKEETEIVPPPKEKTT